MRKLIGKIKYWLCKDYLNKHIKVLQIQKAIPMVDLIQQKDQKFFHRYLEDMARDLANEAIKTAMILEEKTDHKTNSEIVRMKLKVFQD